MQSLHVSRHVVEVFEAITAGGFLAAIAVVGAISVATVVYAWFIA
ncbi:hypothetical protein [Piscinibacter sp.]|jgi:hypothetical protein